MKIVAWKCPTTGQYFEDENLFNTHIAKMKKDIVLTRTREKLGPLLASAQSGPFQEATSVLDLLERIKENYSEVVYLMSQMGYLPREHNNCKIEAIERKTVQLTSHPAQQSIPELAIEGSSEVSALEQMLLDMSFTVTYNSKAPVELTELFPAFKSYLALFPDEGKLQVVKYDDAEEIKAGTEAKNATEQNFYEYFVHTQPFLRTLPKMLELHKLHASTPQKLATISEYIQDDRVIVSMSRQQAKNLAVIATFNRKNAELEQRKLERTQLIEAEYIRYVNAA